MKFPVRKLWVGFCLLGIASAACSLSEPGATEGMRAEADVMKLYRELR